MTLRELLSGIADAIRQKEGSTGEIPAPTFRERILAIMTGVDTSDATATAADMASGVTAYVNGEKVTGTVAAVEQGTAEYIADDMPTLMSSLVTLGASFSEPKLFRAGSYIRMQAPPESFGDATAADVAAGKYFTSAAGVKVLGTGSSGGVPKAFTFTLSSKSHSVAFSGLSKEDYGYLLDCNTLMLFGEADGSQDGVYAAMFPISGSAANRAVAPDQDYFSTYYNDFETPTVAEDSLGITISITAETLYFTAGTTYYVVGFKA